MSIILKIGYKLHNINNRIYSAIISLLYGKSINIGRNVLLGGDVTIGNDCHLGNNSTVVGKVQLSNNVFVHDNVLIRSFKYSILIGSRTTINRNAIIEAQCVIGSDCSIAPNVVIVGSNHVFSDPQSNIKSQGVTSKGIIIENDVWIGANATILDGVTIGTGAIVAAGAVVNKDVPSMCVVAGVPASVVKKRN